MPDFALTLRESTCSHSSHDKSRGTREKIAALGHLWRPTPPVGRLTHGNGDQEELICHIQGQEPAEGLKE